MWPEPCCSQPRPSGPTRARLCQTVLEVLDSLPADQQHLTTVILRPGPPSPHSSRLAVGPGPHLAAHLPAAHKATHTLDVNAAKAACQVSSGRRVPAAEWQLEHHEHTPFISAKTAAAPAFGLESQHTAPRQLAGNLPPRRKWWSART